jgi:hypothetical protein
LRGFGFVVGFAGWSRLAQTAGEVTLSVDAGSERRRFTLNKWGIASVLLCFGDYFVSDYSFHLQDSGKRSLFSTIGNCEQAVVVNLAAVVCGIIASRRGNPLWLAWVFVPAWLTIVSVLCDL